jgi:hypothetical protein
MKRLATTVGCLALGAASLHAIYAPELTRIETGKPWTVAASLRGFYDDNWACQPDWVAGKKDSFGFEARPYLALNLPMEQSYVGLSYLNTSKYYEARGQDGNDPWDFGHEFNLKFDHIFTPRYRLKVTDSFVYSVEPDVVGDIVTVPNKGLSARSDLTYFRNRGAITFTAEPTPKAGVSLTYFNNYYDYQDSGPDSYSARLDRMEHVVPIDLRYRVQPDLVALIGYRFALTDYTGNETFSDGIPSDSRNSQSHAIYLGGDYDITSTLRASLRAGAEYSIYADYGSYNQWTPYVDAALNYYYTTGSHVDLGFKHQTAPTDVAVAANGVPTLDQEVSSVYMLVSHQFSPKLTANFLVQYQWGNFYGGYYGNSKDNLLLLSLYASYHLNQFVSIEAGYTYDWLDSTVTADGLDLRSYNRNQLFLGLRAQY